MKPPEIKFFPYLNGLFEYGHNGEDDNPTILAL